MIGLWEETRGMKEFCGGFQFWDEEEGNGNLERFAFVVKD